MNQSQLFELMDKFDGTKLTKLVYEADGVSICLEKEINYVVANEKTMIQAPSIVAEPSQSTATEQTAIASNYIEIKSPLTGVFYKAASPDSAPFVNVGDKVSKGQIVCLVEAMKLMNEITSPCDGVIKSVCIENGDVVSFDQILFEVEPC